MLLFALIIFATANVMAQPPSGQFGNGQQGRSVPRIGHIYGKLVDSAGKPISDASVIVLQGQFDSSSKTMKQILIKGTTTAKNGDFSLDELPVLGQLTLKISTLNYVPYEDAISFQSKQSSGGSSAMPSSDKDLGNIKLNWNSTTLEGVVVSSTKSMMTLDIDKKVFNVEKNIVSQGGTGLDVMRNVPSVNVDIDGNVSLRNSAPQLFVDGRPTTLSLEQIPADAIESVEVITNPSAKYDASGGGAGILNIVLKKNKKTGYNGNARAGVDKLGAVNGGFDFNARQNKVNFFGSLNYNQRKSNTVGDVSRLNLLDSPQTLINQYNKDKSTGRFIFARAGMDYFITNRTTLSLAGFKVNGKFDPYESIDIYTDSLFNSGIVKGYSNRTSTGTREFNGQGLAFGLKYLFPKEGEEITADANYFSGKMENNSLYTTNQYQNGEGSALTGTTLQKLIGSGNDYNILLQTDYVKPIGTKAKLETGLRASIRGRENNNSNLFYDNAIQEYKLIPSTTNNYTNTDNVYAAYASFANSFKDFGYKIGLRAESSSYDAALTNTNQEFGNTYPISLFPSIFVSQKLQNNQELQASLTRRINRPNFFQLIPFADYTDPLNITQGNPNLVPEFTSSVEATYSKTFKKNNNVLVSAYYKKTDNLITRFIETGTNPFTGSSALINTYINANSSETYGTEITSINYLTTWWDMTTNVNLYNSQINGDDKTLTSDAMWSWFGKFNSNFKLPENFIVQLSAMYQSKTNLTPGGGSSWGGPPGARGGSGGGPGGGFGQAQSASQGYINAYYGIDVAIRKNFLKNNAASATLSFSDIFRTRNVNQHSESDFFIQDYNRLRDPQMIRLSLSYRFGKVDATLFKRKHQSNEGMSDSMQ